MRLRGEARLELAVRAIAVALPVWGLLAAEGSLVSWRGVVFGVVATVVFLASVQAGFRANATDLLALGTLVAAARGTIFGLVIVSALDSWLAGWQLGIASLFLCAGAILVLITLGQAALEHFTSAKRRVLIVGRSGGAPVLIQEVQRLERTPFEVIGVIDDAESAWPHGVRVLGQIEDLSDVIQNERPDLVVVALGTNRLAAFGHLLEHASTGFRVLEIAQFAEHALGRVPVADLNRAWFMSILHLYQRPYSRVTKRAFDLVAASAILLVVLPLLPFVALLVRLTTGPVILRQIRVGENGKLYPMYKFRSMRPDAEKPGEAVWASQGDRRATRVGRFMRRFRLDEVPQLWNVVRGEMSIVGPRPERPEFFEELEEKVPYWVRRQLIKPGITGWAQIRRGYTADMSGSSEKLSYDFWYLRHRSLLVDFAICLHTVGVIVGGSPRAAAKPRRADVVLAAQSTNGFSANDVEADLRTAVEVAGSATDNGYAVSAADEDIARLASA